MSPFQKRLELGKQGLGVGKRGLHYMTSVAILINPESHLEARDRADIGVVLRYTPAAWARGCCTMCTLLLMHRGQRITWGSMRASVVSVAVFRAVGGRRGAKPPSQQSQQSRIARLISAKTAAKLHSCCMRAEALARRAACV